MGKHFNSKAKGSRSELRISKLFGETFNEKFSRTPNSGAFGSTHAKVLSVEMDKMLAGDFITPNNFLWCMENKCGYKEVDLLKLFEDGSNTCKTRISDFLTQCVTDANRVGLKPMVIYTQDRKEPIAIVPSSEGVKEIKTSLNFEAIGERWIIYPLEQLLKIGGREYFFK